MELSTIIIIATLLIIIYLFLKRHSDARRPVKEEEFNQAGVKVSFCNGTIAINDYIYDVNQVARIGMKPYESLRQYQANDGENVVIEMDDHEKPSYKIQFVSSGQAEQFMLRLIRALKLAGRPKFV